MKLNVKAFAITAAILWAGAILITGIGNLISANHTYGKKFLELCASLYPGYHAVPSFGNILVGTGYGLVDAAICGALFAFIYNLFVPKE